MQGMEGGWWGHRQDMSLAVWAMGEVWVGGRDGDCGVKAWVREMVGAARGEDGRGHGVGPGRTGVRRGCARGTKSPHVGL